MALYFKKVSSCLCMLTTSIFSAIEQEPTKDKTKHRHAAYQITADSNTLDTVKEFVYLGSTVSTKNDVNLQIKRRTTLLAGATMVSMEN